MRISFELTLMNAFIIFMIFIGIILIFKERINNFTSTKYTSKKNLAPTDSQENFEVDADEDFNDIKNLMLGPSAKKDEGGAPNKGCRKGRDKKWWCHK